MNKLLPVAALALFSVSGAQAADVLAGRYKQTNARIEALFGRRTTTAANTPIAENPFRTGADSGPAVAGPALPGGPAPVASTFNTDAERLTAAVQALSISGTTIRNNQTYVTINQNNQREGDTVTARLPDGQLVFLRVLKMSPTLTGKKGTVVFGYNDLQVEVQLP